MLQIGHIVEEKYEIIENARHVTISEVYAARDIKTGKKWKVVETPYPVINGISIPTLPNEAELGLLNRLNHPNIPKITAINAEKDRYIYVIEWIDGIHLDDQVKKAKIESPAYNDAQNPFAVISWALQLCEMIIYLNSRKPPIIHFDICPRHILLKRVDGLEKKKQYPFGQIKVLGWEMARELDPWCTSQFAGGMMGTSGYMAPEQYDGKMPSDVRTEIYQIGTTMFHLLTGYSPRDINDCIYMVGRFLPDLRGSWIEWTVSKCCELTITSRFQTPAELMNSLYRAYEELYCLMPI